eukprot:354014-Chlamydomonas_euryale.AAC.1
MSFSSWCVRSASIESAVRMRKFAEETPVKKKMSELMIKPMTSQNCTIQRSRFALIDMRYVILPAPYCR